ncbi:telomere repeats-binding bouquet formation protein 2 [Hemibagrus wyckioides]|uniref:telomere repeats-binding bouquet formation protein 2 n=1 Tax=Hemibagrus wyckioides TaxID=337641 RepID=UPI00266B8970|nr:telomere repeats-binding bouquet formation protein 2 [Hemibagrus wyckioides]
MFKNKTAWFSDSVKTDISRFWVAQGGIITDWKTADYLFSEHASCPDTKRIHASDEYVMDRATVFHSAYLSTCRLRQSTKSVPLGHYLLPPVSVQREVKARMGRFIWEQDEMLGVTHQPDVREGKEKKRHLYIHVCHVKIDGNVSLRQENTSPSREESVCCETQLYPVNNMLSGYVHIDQLMKFSGELHDFLPSHSGYSVSRSHSRRLPFHFKERL